MKTSERTVPEPTVMPVDREVWARQLGLCNFVNSYYQYRDLQSCPNCRKVLIVGPGQGLDTQVLRWRGYDVATFDIDDTFKPDYLGSVHDMRMFGDRQFDAVIASHVLEHLALPYLEPALIEIARIATHALVYLPVAGRHVQARVQPGFKGWDWSLVVDLFNYRHRPSGIEPRYSGGQHFWEVGYRGFRLRDVRARLERHFEIVNVYRNYDWNPSLNFVLKSRASG